MIAALRTVRLPIDALKPHPKNPRTHPEAGSPEWNLLAGSLEHDYFDPIVWNKRNGLLVSGHFRTKIFKSQGVTDIDVVEVDYDDPTHLARMLAANRLFGEDDDAKQLKILEELSSLGDSFSWSTAAIDMDELANLGVDLGGASVFEAGNPFVEKVPEAPANAAERPAAPTPEQPSPEELKAPPEASVEPESVPAPTKLKSTAIAFSLSGAEYVKFIEDVATLSAILPVEEGADTLNNLKRVVVAAVSLAAAAVATPVKSISTHSESPNE